MEELGVDQSQREGNLGERVLHCYLEGNFTEKKREPKEVGEDAIFANP